ncbi:regulatory protein GemA [Motilimonas cestriensis]|uniref:Regulatory protein GemA n=1 Tax=Motilimonas cestriensis TaxID=2742685 RepID=A0ABS8W7G5_9GAMM|nr:regulatory protein GemA [Motilimonas cestriensis]MCE2594430.1 regulatory protein GemA [Motilimonas cestriensis]
MTTAHRKSLITRIHIAKAQLKLDDDIYQAILASATKGKTSCSTMSLPELMAVMAAFEQRGFKTQKPTRKPANKTKAVRAPELAKINAIWRTMHQQGFVRDGSERALTAYSKRITGIAQLTWLQSNQASRVLESLKKWHTREMVKQLGEQPKNSQGKTPSYATICDIFQQAQGEQP